MHRVEFLIVFTLLWLSCTKAVKPVSFPARPEDWKYELDFGYNDRFNVQLSERWWDRAFLQRAASITHYEQLWALIRKLRRGEPISIVGFGSSVMANHAGCFHTSRERLASRLGIRHIETTENYDALIPSDCYRDGYMGLFMRILNKTFPHPDHVFYNMGRSGRPLSTWTSSFCACADFPLAGPARLLADRYRR